MTAHAPADVCVCAAVLCTLTHCCGGCCPTAVALKLRIHNGYIGLAADACAAHIGRMSRTDADTQTVC